MTIKTGSTVQVHEQHTILLTSIPGSSKYTQLGVSCYTFTTHITKRRVGGHHGNMWLHMELTTPFIKDTSIISPLMSLALQACHVYVYNNYYSPMQYVYYYYYYINP